MICQICGKNEAAICMVRMTNNTKDALYICPVCAAKLENELTGGLGNLLGPMFANAASRAAGQGAICPGCGQTRREFEESGLMNCKDCYTLFRSERSHVGKVPGGSREELILINLLKEKESRLKKLVAEERYEEAAKVRDEIRGLKEEGRHE